MDKLILLELRLAEAEDKNKKLREKILTDALKIVDLRAQLAEAEAEVERLRERDEMAKRLADYCRMTIETGELNNGSSIAVAYRDYIATRGEQV